MKALLAGNKMVDPNWIIAAAIVIQTICAVIALFRRGESRSMVSTRRWPIIGVALMTVIAWAAVGFDFYDRHFGSSLKREAIMSWGAVGQQLHPGDPFGPPVYTLLIDGSALQEYKDKFNAMLIVRVPYSNVDRLSDPAIEKSVLYSIENGPMPLAHPSDGRLKFPGGQLTYVEFNLALLPKTITADQIMRLQDVSSLGGILVAKVAQAITGGPPIPIETPKP